MGETKTDTTGFHQGGSDAVLSFFMVAKRASGALKQPVPCQDDDKMVTNILKLDCMTKNTLV
jgi:hypothetical protein